MKRTIAPILKGLAVAMLVLCCMLPAGKAGAADDTVKTPTPTPTPIQDYVNKEQYLNGYYRGYINSDSATVYAGPGTKAFPKVTLDDGTVVTLTKNTEVFVWGETKDVDLDPWYHITAVFKDKEIEGYIYKPRVTRENTQILFTPTPTPEPTPTEVPVLPTDVPDDQISPIPGVSTPTPTSPPNVDEVVSAPKNRKWIPILVVCLIVIALIIVYTIFQRIQEKKLEEEMERYSKRRPAMERIDGEDEEDFKEAKKNYYASMNFGHDEDGKPVKPSRPEKPASKYDSSFEDDEEEDGLSDDDVRVVDDFRRKGADKAPAKTEDSFDVSDDDLAYFDRLKGKTEAPSGNAIKKAGSAASILDETPVVDSYFEADEPTPEERLRIKIDALRAQDPIVHKLYGEGIVVDNTDSEIIQVRFGRDLRFLKKDKLARKELVEL